MYLLSLAARSALIAPTMILIWVVPARAIIPETVNLGGSAAFIEVRPHVETQVPPDESHRVSRRTGGTADPVPTPDNQESGQSDEQTDLSGTYAGRVKMLGAHETEGDAILTISGNRFTLEVNGQTHAGRISAVTSRGYTGVSLVFDDIINTATNTPLVAMARARKRGDGLRLSPVPGSRNSFSFAGPIATGPPKTAPGTKKKSNEPKVKKKKTKQK